MAGKFEDFRQNVKQHKGFIGVAISGGLDSTVVLHELCEKNNPAVITAYCLKQGKDSPEHRFAEKIAEAYGVKFIYWDFEPKEYWSSLAECMTFFDRPRWNIWPYILLEFSKLEKVEHFYVGEGSDEIFGYLDRSYLKGWISQLEYIWPVWKQSADHLGIQLHAPFLELERGIDGVGLPTTLGYFCGRAKCDLWEEYKDKLKAPVIYPKSPCVAYYDILKKSKQELLVEATKMWLKDK